MIKTNHDIPVGAIVTSKKNNTYIVMVDDAGQRGLFTKTGTWFRFNGDELTFGKGFDGIQTIKIFDTLPPLDALSEGVKMMYTGRPACAHTCTIYNAEDPRVTDAKRKMQDLADEMARQQNIIDRFGR